MENVLPQEAHIPERGSYRHYDPDNLTRAYLAVKDENMSTNKAAKVFCVPRTTLQDRLYGKVDVETLKSGPQPLFSQEQESLLAGHLKTMDEVGFGYSRQETINLASDYAVELGLRDKGQPLTDRWLYKFLGRWPDLSVKKPRSLEIARAKSATRSVIDNYFEELNHILTKHDLHGKPHRIYNIDEKGLSTEHKPPKVIGGKFSKSQAVTSGKGKTVTLIGCANGVGQVIPPYFVFPGARMLESLLEGASAGAKGNVSESGWSNSNIFSDYIQNHLMKYLPSTEEDDILVLYDGHKSHITIPVIQWAKSHRIHLFVLPPHCSHLLQPLDVSCFGPFQTAWNSACHNFIRESGGSVITRYEVCRLACKVYASTLTPGNVQSSFHKSGIYPFEKNVIQDSQVAPATTFDRDPQPTDGTPAPISDAPADLNIQAESYLLNRGGKILQNVQKAKSRNTISKVVGGKCITEDSVFEKIIEHNAKYSTKKSSSQHTKPTNKVKRTKSVQPSTSGIQIKKKKTTRSENFSSSESDDDIDDSDKCIVCQRFSPDSSKRPDLIIVNWGQCESCHGWVHLSFCTTVRVLRRGDKFLCPGCSESDN